MTVAPDAWARTGVASREPSSTTTTLYPARLTSPTTRAITVASLWGGNDHKNSCPRDVVHPALPRWAVTGNSVDPKKFLVCATAGRQPQTLHMRWPSWRLLLHDDAHGVEQID